MVGGGAGSFIGPVHRMAAELDGTIELVTRRGKVHQVKADDPRLRPARLWERWMYRDRFPDLNHVSVQREPAELTAAH